MSDLNNVRFRPAEPHEAQLATLSAYESDWLQAAFDQLACDVLEARNAYLNGQLGADPEVELCLLLSQAVSAAQEVANA